MFIIGAKNWIFWLCVHCQWGFLSTDSQEGSFSRHFDASLPCSAWVWTDGCGCLLRGTPSCPQTAGGEDRNTHYFISKQKDAVRFPHLFSCTVLERCLHRVKYIIMTRSTDTHKYQPFAFLINIVGSRRTKHLKWRRALAELSPHLYGVVQGRAGRMQRQVLERFDLRSIPAVLLRPADGQHVVGELLSEHQGGGVGLGLACCVAFDDEICCLRRGWTNEPETGREEEVDGTRAEAVDGYSDCF